MDNKLIVVIMGIGKKHFAEMCLDSVKEADVIQYFTQRWIGLSKEIEIDTKAEFYGHDWDETDKTINAKCRNNYLKHIKKHYPDDWCLVLDEDELIDDLDKVKQFIQTAKPGIYNVKMRHFIGDLGHEDATHPMHVVPGRLFKISEAKGYPLHSHPVLKGELIGDYLDTTIFHLGHLPIEYMDYILTRYKQHVNDSVIHTPEYLKEWFESHIFGVYPVKPFTIIEMPKQLCERYEIDKDKFYFKDDILQAKHTVMVKQWYDYFKPKSVLDLGCGRGIFLYIWEWFVKNYKGVEISKYAIDNSICKSNKIIKDNITTMDIKGKYDLVVVFDVLEHLKYEDLENTLINIKKHTIKDILISIPYEDDPNINLDPTHIIKESKKWWLKKLKKHFNIKNTPDDWLFNQQIIVGEKK